MQTPHRQRVHPSPATPKTILDPKQFARNASLNALTGGSASSSSTTHRSPSSRYPSSSSNAPSMESEHTIEVGDTVEVPGGMSGVVKFIGGVKGKAGVFAGVELHRDFAARGKNDGDVDGIKYFTTTIPGAGIFLPVHRAVKQSSPTLSASTFPPTPTTPAFATFDLNKSAVHNLPNTRTPPTPSLPKFSQSVGPGTRPNFSQSVGPGARAPSPQLKKTRQSLPRPESPLRKQTVSLQPTQPRAFSQSARGGRPTLGLTPSKIGSGRPSISPAPPRTTSRSQSRQDDRSILGDDTPTQRPSVSNGFRPFSGGTLHGSSRASSQEPPANNNADVAHLRSVLEERDRQLRDQAGSLAEMENSLAELQSLVAANSVTRSSPPRLNGDDVNEDIAQLRSMLREKNERIQLLTSEFDSHRADFRSTIDALEMASTETERVYEKRVQELLQENAELSERGSDVENVARQLKQLEELVAELEDGLEDARRGEAEARSEVEFLRGEVERGRTELRREREKAAKALKGATGAVMNEPSKARSSRELEQRDDEIRGLKAIIHSLSSGSDMGTPTPERPKAGLDSKEKDELARLKESLAGLQREKSELQGMVERKSFREEELERELMGLREKNGATKGERNQHAYHNSMASTRTAIRPTSSDFTTNERREKSGSSRPGSISKALRGASRPGTSNGADALASPLSAVFHDAPSQHLGESPSAIADTASSVVTEGQYCDFCDSADHDILSCSSINGSTEQNKERGAAMHRHTDSMAVAPLRSKKSTASLLEGVAEEKGAPGPEINAASTGTNGKLELKDYPEGKAAPGKSSGAVDMSKWCAMCEHEGHESIDCPFEEDF